MHCTVVYPLDLYPAFFGYYFFNFMMVVLQSLHIFWAYLIIRMAQKFITGKARGGLGAARGSQSRGAKGLYPHPADAAWGGGRVRICPRSEVEAGGLQGRPPNREASLHLAS